MPKKERGSGVVATNRRARHEYTIEDTYEAGIERQDKRESDRAISSKRHLGE
jgi:hypothetical protein